jgi:hypothetical protein
LSASYSPSLVLTWADHRPRRAWCAACFLLLAALVEIAWRGYGLWALLGLLVWMPVAWLGRPARPVPQELLLGPQGHQLRQTNAAEPIAIDVLPGTVLLPSVVVLHWRPVGGRGRRFLWLWARDLGDDCFRDLRRWWLVYGQKSR